MKFGPSLIEARLIKRYKRFLADVTLLDGSTITVHCPNTGKMTGCAEPGSRVWLSDSQNPKRKYRYTWELVETATGLAYTHSAKANALVKEALTKNQIAELTGYAQIKAEQPYGDRGSRVDFLLQGSKNGDNRPDCFVEVKAVTLDEQGIGYFPDTVSARGLKHLEELSGCANAGQRAVLLFCVQHQGIKEVRPAAHIDPKYAAGVEAALTQGVEVIAYRAEINTIADGEPEQIILANAVLFSLG
ncbi:MAG: DNA/RNA nuclease SfsA [Pseudomonadales bacterium]|nr:DNA/RNA nuclease SfsA [Pseudomonadales bacterium]